MSISHFAYVTLNQPWLWPDSMLAKVAMQNMTVIIGFRGRSGWTGLEHFF